MRRRATGNPRNILELKLHHQSVAAPTAIRLHQPGKADGEYLPRGEFSGARKGLPAPMLAWIKEHAGEPRPASKGSKAPFKFHPDFDLEAFLENEGCTEKALRVDRRRFTWKSSPAPTVGKEPEGIHAWRRRSRSSFSPGPATGSSAMRAGSIRGKSTKLWKKTTPSTAWAGLYLPARRP